MMLAGRHGTTVPVRAPRALRGGLVLAGVVLGLAGFLWWLDPGLMFAPDLLPMGR